MTAESESSQELQQQQIDELKERLAKLEDLLIRPRRLGRATNWTATPERCVIKCLIGAIKDEDYQQSNLSRPLFIYCEHSLI